MKFYSTDQPPLVPMQSTASAGAAGGSAGATSTDQPPHSQTRQFLKALQTGDALSTLDFWRIRLLKEQGLIPQLTMARRLPLGTTAEQNNQAGWLKDKSFDVVQMLATADFWAATEVSGSAWTATGDTPTSQVKLVPRMGPAQAAWAHTLQAVDAPAYLASVVGVASTMSGSPVNMLQQITAQAGLPHLFMPIALGMADEKAPQRRHTCAVVDVVHAVVNVAVHRLKHVLQVPRPHDKRAFPSTTVEPLIPVPGYTAYPSGHAALMFALATVLGKLVAADVTQQAHLEVLASSIATNREHAGLHTALDTQAGRDLGHAMGRWMIEAVDHPAFGPWSALYVTAANEWT